MQIGFYFDQTRCTGCSACVVACKDWNDVPAGPEKWIRLHYIEKGKFPDIYVGYQAIPCYHCLSPVCVPACPVGAIQKRAEDGIVIIDPEVCIGKDACKAACLKACPYDAPQFAPEADSKMKKCDFCRSRHSENKLPVCVEACPTRALDAGSLEELKTRYGELTEAEGFTYSSRTRPAVIFKPKKDMRKRKD